MSSCSLPEGSVHAHVDRCYQAGGADALRELAADLAPRSDLAEALGTSTVDCGRVVLLLQNRAALIERGLR